MGPGGTCSVGIVPSGEHCPSGLLSTDLKMKPYFAKYAIINLKYSKMCVHLNFTPKAQSLKAQRVIRSAYP